MTRIAFEPYASRLVLSASRDRKWALYAKNEHNDYDLVAMCGAEHKGHSRIIWDCAFVPKNESQSDQFVTVGRDKQVG